MSAKAAMKQAKELLTAGDFRGALKCCNRAINADKDNYLAHVIAGKCQDEIGDKAAAERMYDAAVAKDPAQLPAWQGKAKLYEQMGEERADKLAEAYKRLADHHLSKENDLTKYMVVAEKLWKLREKSGNLESAAEVIAEQMAACAERSDRHKERECRSELIRLLAQRQDDLSAGLLDTLRTNLETAVSASGADQSIQNMENFKTLIKLYYKLREMEELQVSNSHTMRMYVRICQNIFCSL